MRKIPISLIRASVLADVAPTPTAVRLEGDSPSPPPDFPYALLRPIFIPNARFDANLTIQSATLALRRVRAGVPGIETVVEIPVGEVSNSSAHLSNIGTGHLRQLEIFYTCRMERHSS